MESTRTKVVKSFFWKFLERFSVQGINFIVTIVLARVLLPEDYGVVALVSIFLTLAEVIAEGGFGTALVQKKDSDNIDFSTVFYFSLIIAIILYGTLFVSAPLISKFFKQGSLSKLLRVLGLSVVFYSINSVQKAYVSRKMLFRKLFVCTLVAVIVSGFLGIVMAFRGMGAWALVIQALSNQIFTTLLLWLVVKWHPNLVFSKQRFLQLFDFGWKILTTNFIITLFTRIRTLVIGKLFSPSSLAYYEKGNQFPSLISENVCGSIQTVIFPVLSEAQDDRTKVAAMMQKVVNTSCLFMFPIMLGMFSCAEQLVVLLLTEKWIGAVPFLRIVCLAFLFTPISIPNQQAITSLGYSGLTLKMEAIRKCLDVVILVVSCFFGIKAIAWGVVLYDFLCLFINLFPNRRLLNITIIEQLYGVLPSFIAAIIMLLSIYWINYMSWHPAIQLTTSLFLGTLIYGIMCRLFKIECFMEILNIIRRK